MLDKRGWSRQLVRATGTFPSAALMQVLGVNSLCKSLFLTAPPGFHTARRVIIFPGWIPEPVCDIPLLFCVPTRAQVPTSHVSLLPAQLHVHFLYSLGCRASLCQFPGCFQRCRCIFDVFTGGEVSSVSS